MMYQTKSAIKVTLICLFFQFIFSIPSFALEICGHRGARGLFPENTLYGIRQALKLPIHCIDMDVVLSQDKVPVLYHDLRLNPDYTRFKHGSWVYHDQRPIKSLSFKKLQQFNVGKLNPQRHYAAHFPQQQSLKLATIPSLKQALLTIIHDETTPHQIQIELKTEPNNPASPSYQELALQVAHLIYQLHLEQRCKIQSFDWRILIFLHQHFPKLALAFLTEQHPSFPPMYRHPASIPQLIKKLHGQYWDAQDSQLSLKDIQHAHQLNLKVCAWSLATRDTQKLITNYQRLIRQHIDCIITDRPDLLLSMKPNA